MRSLRLRGATRPALPRPALPARPLRPPPTLASSSTLCGPSRFTATTASSGGRGYATASTTAESPYLFRASALPLVEAAEGLRIKEAHMLDGMALRYQVRCRLAPACKLSGPGPLCLLPQAAPSWPLLCLPLRRG